MTHDNLYLVSVLSAGLHYNWTKEGIPFVLTVCRLESARKGKFRREILMGQFEEMVLQQTPLQTCPILPNVHRLLTN